MNKKEVLQKIDLGNSIAEYDERNAIFVENTWL